MTLREFLAEEVSAINLPSSRKVIHDKIKADLEFHLLIASQIFDAPDYARVAHRIGEILTIYRQELAFPPELEGDEIDESE